VKAPKLYGIDSGAAAWAANAFDCRAAVASAKDGALMETFALSDVMAWDGLSGASRYHFWRTGAGAEVDLLIERGEEVVAIEVKSAVTLTRHDVSGLDLACGPAPKSFSLARAHLGVRVTLLDWEQILTIASQVAADLGVQSQVTPLPGDLWTVPYGSNHYDVIYLGNITHFFGPEQNTCLFRRVRDALVEEGTLVVDAIRREYPDPMGPGLWFYAVSEGGAPYDFPEYKRMLERAGYTDIVDASTQSIRASKRT